MYGSQLNLNALFMEIKSYGLTYLTKYASQYCCISVTPEFVIY